MKTPRNFQIDSVERFRKQVGLIIADDCGLGKTLTGIEAVKAVCSAHWRILLLCPPSIITQWQDAIAEQMPDVPIMTTNFVPYSFDTMEFEGWVIMSYYELYKEYMRGSVGSILWDCIVADESHRFRNRSNKLFKYVTAIPKSRALALTATPMEHGQHEVWGNLRFVRPDKFKAYWGFVTNNFNIEEGLYTKFEIAGPKDPTALAEKLSPYIIQHHKRDVMPELPPRIDIPTNVAMDKSQKELYDIVKQHPDIELNVQDKRLLLKNALSVLVKLQQISSWPNLLGLSAPSGKLRWVAEFLEDHPRDRAVIFTRFRPLADWLSSNPDTCLIAGGVNEINDFKGGYVRHAACVIADSLQGVDGLQDAQHAIFVDGHWSSTQMTQALDRIHRMDITEPKNVYLLSSTREDKLVYKAVEKKWTEQELLYYLLQELRDAGTV